MSAALGKIKHAEFAMASGEMCEAEFTAFLDDRLCNLADRSADGAIALRLHGLAPHGDELETAGRKAGLHRASEPLRLEQDQRRHGELLSLQARTGVRVQVGTAPHINNFELGSIGRYRTNVWDYAGVNSLRRRAQRGAGHASDGQAGGDGRRCDQGLRGAGPIVLDAFAGSGTTIMAAKKTGRVGCALELDPRYVDVAIQRWNRISPKKAVHAETGLSFDELAATRRAAIEARCKTRVRARAAHGGSDRGR